MVSVHCHVTATHSGPGLWRAKRPSCGLLGALHGRVQNGQLVEGWNTFDFLTCYQQIGLLPQQVGLTTGARASAPHC